METEKKINIEDYGEVIIKKFTFADRCFLKGKVVNITIDKGTGLEKTEIDSGAIFFWTTILSIKSLPNHPEFHTYDTDKKQLLVSEIMANNMEIVMTEALEYNKLNTQVIGKKNIAGSEKETKRPEDKPKD